jgi:hypothetical protein
MKTKKRILLYLILSVVYFFGHLFFVLLTDKNLTLTNTIGFSLINIAFAFVLFKQKIIFNIITGIILANLCLFLAMKFRDSIATADTFGTLFFLINIILSLFFWEILYQIKNKKSSN